MIIFAGLRSRRTTPWPLAMLLAVALLALALPGCGAAARIAQATAVRGLAVAGLAAERAVLARYEAEGHAAIDAAAGGGVDAVEDALQDVRDRWAPALAALDSMRAGLGAWLAAVEHERPSWGAALDVVCRAVAAVEPLAPEAIGPVADIVEGVCP